jgi:dihydroorotate dehydrogenase (NAD+) catalytic subunit
VNGPDLSVELAGMTLKNPVMTASGTFGYGREFSDFTPPELLGAVVTKGISLAARAGNPPPRIVETASGMLNAIGLENVGLDEFIWTKLPWLRERAAVVVANILGESVEDYAALAEGLDKADGVAMIEVNVSCPNVASGGLAFGADPAALFDVVRAVTGATHLPVMVKLTPMTADIRETASAAVEAGAQGLSLINTIPAMAVDHKTRRPKLANIVGGLSGPAIKPVALRLVWQAASCVSVPVVGIGGIMSAEDALEFILVGATAVQVGTANFINPRIGLDIIEGIRSYMVKEGITDISSLIGGMIAEK